MLGWHTSTLGNLCEIGDGNHSSKYPKKSEMVESGVPFIRGTNLIDGILSSKNILFISPEKHEQLKKGHLKSGDVLFTNRGEIGKVAIVSDEFDGANLNSQIAWLRCGDHLIPEYLFFFLQSKVMRDHFDMEKSGAALQQFTIKMLKVVEVYFPAIPEQKRIVAILNQAFADIEQAHAKTEQNHKNARELFENYLQQVFSQRGEGWVEVKLEDLFDIGSSKRIYETDWTSSGVPFYGGKEIVKLAKYGTTNSNAYISEEKYMDYASKYDMPQKDDILMTARGTIGVGYIVKEGDKFYYKDGNIISFRQKTPTNPQFILYAFRSKQIVDQIEGLTGTTVNHLPLKKAKEIVHNIPKYHVQNLSVLQIKKMEIKIQHLTRIYESKLLSIEELKKSILQKAFSGELTRADKEAESKGEAA